MHLFCDAVGYMDTQTWSTLERKAQWYESYTPVDIYVYYITKESWH